MIIADKKYNRGNFLYPTEKIVEETTHPEKLVQRYFENSETASLRLINTRKRTRWIVKKGIENVVILLDDIVLFYTENKIVYVVDHLGRKYIASGTLSGIGDELDQNIFFRANRQFIISVNHVKSFRSYERVKLKVNMWPDELNDRYSIIIAQETAAAFRKWIYAA